MRWCDVTFMFSKLPKCFQTQNKSHEVSMRLVSEEITSNARGSVTFKESLVYIVTN